MPWSSAALCLMRKFHPEVSGYLSSSLFQSDGEDDVAANSDQTVSGIPIIDDLQRLRTVSAVVPSSFARFLAGSLNSGCPFLRREPLLALIPRVVKSKLISSSGCGVAS